MVVSELRADRLMWCRPGSHVTGVVSFIARPRYLIIAQYCRVEDHSWTYIYNIQFIVFTTKCEIRQKNKTKLKKNLNKIVIYKKINTFTKYAFSGRTKLP